MAQQVKDPALPQPWRRLKLWYGFDPWPGNFHMPQMWPKKKKMVIKHHYIEKGMWNYVYLDNKKFFPKSRVNCIKMVIVVVLGWWEDGYVLYFLNLL